MAAEKARFAISVGGIALAVFLMSFLLSLYQGWRLSVGRFVDHVNADVWVARQGTTDFLLAASFLPADMGDKLAGISGVERVDSLIVAPRKVKIDGTLQGLHLVGYQLGAAGGPPGIAKGKQQPGPDEIIVDEAFKRKSGVNIGDEIKVGDHSLKVVGISTGGNLIFSQVGFMSIETARSALGMDGLTTFYLIHLEKGAKADAVTRAVDGQITGVNAFSRQEFAAATRDGILRNVVPILFVVLALAAVVGVAITGLTIYNAVVEKQREFGILKALGFTNRYLFRLVLEQSLATGALGFSLGAVSTVIAASLVPNVVPQFVTLIRLQDIGLVLGATLLMSIVAAVLPVRRIANVDPVAVFS
jgi:putative ABC transport system permease protein